MMTREMDDEVKPYDEIKISNREHVLLLELIMIDIRMNWENQRTVLIRKAMALRLAMDLCFFACVGRLFMFNKNDDGRWLRAPAAHGGYEGLEEVHKFPSDEAAKYSFNERSDEFKRLVKKYLTPDLMDAYFNDINQSKQI